jgi:hypothetical protein
MTYVKPEIIVHGEGDAAEWAVPEKSIPALSAEDCACNCASSGSKVCHAPTY